MKAPRNRKGLPALDPFRHQGVTVETERSFDGRRSFVEPSVTVFLTGAECPFQCTFCDLWRYTIDGPTPPGALPAQLDSALSEVPQDHRGGLLKLYNASNWFEPKAVPEGDDERIVERIVEYCAGFRRVVVESHARLVGDRCRKLGDALDGRLQVALGVETVQPAALAALNKGLELDDLRAAAAKLLGWGVEIRTFVLIGAPGVAEADVGTDAGLDWIERSCEFSLELGAVAVSMIPLRPTADQQHAPSLDLVEAAWRRCRALSPAVQLDTWDLDRLAPDGDREAEAKVQKLRDEQLEVQPTGVPA